MPVRDLIRIDEELCDGCGLCVPACAEGAIQIVDGKARLVSKVLCDGLGACLGHCPHGALTVEQVEAEAFDEESVARHLATGEEDVAEVGPRANLPVAAVAGPEMAGGCPGSRMMQFNSAAAGRVAGAPQPSALRQWPVQLHLVSPMAPYFRDADVLLAADCVAFAMGRFHSDFLVGHGLAIACPKLDSNQESYVEKLVAMIDQAGVRSITVMVMEVPCCSGLARLARLAVARASRPVPVRLMVVGIRGDVLRDQEMPVAGEKRPGGPGPGVSSQAHQPSIDNRAGGLDNPGA